MKMKEGEGEFKKSKCSLNSSGPCIILMSLHYLYLSHTAKTVLEYMRLYMGLYNIFNRL